MVIKRFITLAPGSGSAEHGHQPTDFEPCSQEPVLLNFFIFPIPGNRLDCLSLAVRLKENVLLAKIAWFVKGKKYFRILSS
jgi:hypothetical protein